LGNITSNVFDLNLDSFSLANNDLKIGIKDYSHEITSNNKADAIKKECEKKNQVITKSDSSFTIIEVDKKNFNQYQYFLLNQNNIAYMLEENNYKFITLDHCVYIISDEKLIKMILNMPRPRKIVYSINAGELLSKSIYSMQLLANILEDKKTTNIQELLTFWGHTYIDDYNSLYILIEMFNKYEKLIYKNQYNSYINFEQKIYNIFSFIKYNIDPMLLTTRTKECEDNINLLLKKLNIDGLDIDADSFEILNYIASLENNDGIFPSLNLKLLESIDMKEYMQLIELIDERKFIKKVTLGNISYDTYEEGCISSYKPYINNYTNNIVIRGTYAHLTQNILAEILRKQKYIDIVNGNNNILEFLLIKNNIKYTDNMLIMLEWILMASINGCDTYDDYVNYIYINYYTLLSHSDVEYMVNIIKGALCELSDMITNYCNNKIITDNFIIHENITPLNSTILSTKRKLFKNLILDISEYITDFNRKNSTKLYFVGYDDDSIYIECEEDALNVGIDTLTRTLIRIYDLYLKKTKAHCHIEKL
jgi:hypothetical protein